MIHSSCRSNCACTCKYSSCGTGSPPALNCILSNVYKGSRVSSARRLARVDFPPPAFPNTATRFIAWGMAHAYTSPATRKHQAGPEPHAITGGQGGACGWRRWPGLSACLRCNRCRRHYARERPSRANRKLLCVVAAVQPRRSLFNSPCQLRQGWWAQDGGAHRLEESREGFERRVPYRNYVAATIEGLGQLTPVDPPDTPVTRGLAGDGPPRSGFDSGWVTKLLKVSSRWITGLLPSYLRPTRQEADAKKHDRRD